LPTTGLNQAANKSFAEDSDSYDCFIADTSPPTASPHSNSRIETEALRLGNIQPSLVGSGKKRLLSSSASSIDSRTDIESFIARRNALDTLFLSNVEAGLHDIKFNHYIRFTEMHNTRDTR